MLTSFLQEESECCERVFCAPCRSLTLKLYQGSSSAGPVALIMEKVNHALRVTFAGSHRLLPNQTWSCPQMPKWILLHPMWCVWGPWIYCGFQHPAQVTVKEPDGTVIGTIDDPPEDIYHDCNSRCVVKNLQGDAILQLGPSYICECGHGQCCPCCADHVVPLRRMDDTQVGTVTRQALSCAECLGKTNRFTVDFGEVTEPQERKLVFAVAMLFDLQYWEVNKDN